MTIRLQNLLVIPPIFLLLGLAVGYLADRTAHGQILWGLDQESNALAVTVADMTGGSVLDRLAAGDSATERKVRTHLDELARHGQVASIILYSRATGAPVLSWDRDGTATSLERRLWATSLRGVRSDTVLGGVRPWGPYPAVMVAAAPIYAPHNAADRRGTVAVLVDASRMASITHRLRRDFGVLALAVTLLGVAAALFLSARIGRQVKELGRVGASVAAGEYKVPVQVSGVKEVQDLSNTLGTMASILSDVLARGRRALLVGDSFQLSQGMAGSYKEARLVDAPPPAGLDVGFSPIGKLPPGCFHGWTETPTHAVLWVGEIAGAEPLDLAVQAAAADRALRHGLRGGDPYDVARTVSQAFDFSALQVAWLTRPASGPAEARTVAGTGVPVRKGDYCVIHSFSSQETEALSGSLSLVKHLPAAEAAREMPLALPRTLSGAILLVRPAHPLPQGGPS